MLNIWTLYVKASGLHPARLAEYAVLEPVEQELLDGRGPGRPVAVPLSGLIGGYDEAEPEPFVERRGLSW